ncbi:hypothetical protein [Paenibacillus glycanilyticus]|uniref:hypothetical protein n=1 Tax=Paenibacillus glycanilyticus TaxID=126569 RepID=UPI00191024C1|nr:hypothetical protein [Paenibacillus glycanilyticus]
MNAAPQAMLLEKREEPFDDSRYIFEPKIDGHRLLLVKDGDSVKLWTRHENASCRVSDLQGPAEIESMHDRDQKVNQLA